MPTKAPKFPHPHFPNPSCPSKARTMGVAAAFLVSLTADAVVALVGWLAASACLGRCFFNKIVSLALGKKTAVRGYSGPRTAVHRSIHRLCFRGETSAAAALTVVVVALSFSGCENVAVAFRPPAAIHLQGDINLSVAFAPLGSWLRSKNLPDFLLTPTDTPTALGLTKSL